MAKTVKVQGPDPTKTTRLEKILGGVVLAAFITIWLSSIASPALFLAALYHHYYGIAATIVFLTVAAYWPWEEKGPWIQAFQEQIAHYSPCYYRSVSIHFEGQEHSDTQTLYAIHPHGAFCMGWSILFCHKSMQKVRFCFAPALYLSPFFRLFTRCTGKPGSAAKANMIHYLKNGEDLALPPGGFEEATLSCLYQDRVFCRKRTGFVRLCLQHGVSIRPVYVFGERSLYWNIQGGFKHRLALNRYGLPTILTWGHPLAPLVPKNTVDLTILVGAPIVLPKIENPSKEEVQTWHEKYVASLTRIFEEYKEMAYGADAKTCKLEVW